MITSVFDSTIEFIGVGSGILYVWLTARENIWCWPVGLLNVASYTIVFYDSKLYADMSLQCIYIALTFYGWLTWKRGGKNKKERKITNAPFAELLMAALVASLIWLCVWYILHTFTDGAITWADSLLMSASCAATWLAARKYLANWIWWIIIDTLYLPLYIYKGLYFTSVLYVLFGIMAWRGYGYWRKKLESAAV